MTNKNMQQLLAQANKMKRDLARKMKELHEKEFTVTKGGGVKVVMLGNKEIVKIAIDEELFDLENKEMVETLLIMAVNECREVIDKEEAEINESVTGSSTGFF
ncbi:MAG TPA: YbaB/EbfC family nucleoid-associated protein [Bacilli bacterium]|nr:YbaB/EbfC family nucleoid-associated protein [Bacilli bacterium]